MAGNTNKFVTKNGLRTQNAEFLSPDRANTINIEMLDSDTLSFEGDAGQLFSITDSLTGTIFSVNDISGIPSIEVDDDGTIRFAEFSGNVLIGTATDDGTNKLQVDGSVSATSFSGNLESSDVTITGGSITGITDLAVADGGTGASTPENARANLGVAYNEIVLKTSPTGAVELPIGNTAQRPDPATTGMFRFNTDSGKFEGYDGIEWVEIQSSFTFEGDLNTLSGTEDLESGAGTFDLMD